MSDLNTEELLQRKELSDILLVLDKIKMKIQAVTGIGEGGELKTVDPIRKIRINLCGLTSLEICFLIFLQFLIN